MNHNDALAGDQFDYDLPIEISAASVFSFSSSKGSFDFSFQNFSKGTSPQAVSIDYQIQANDVRGNSGLLIAQINSVFDGVDFYVQLGAYQNLGGNASLVKAGSDFILLSSSMHSIANKQKLSGNGKILWGNFSMLYKVTANKDLEAGNQTRILTLTFLGD